ncbi:phosphatase PAP2 family protein [Streptomyces mirabilis]|uniref:phosphatase PAP2 family protein n=1 Tax=Streptomyces sp. NPDC005388 TaxID=3156717 RepID=UPI0033BE1DEA
MPCGAIDRPRPPAAERLTETHGASFPSRHTATALIAAHLVTGGQAPQTLSVAVGLSRLALRAHWPTDVVGGWLFGYGWLAAAELARSSVPHASRR